MNSSGYQDVDVAITTRELAYLIKDMDIDLCHAPAKNLSAAVKK